MTPTGGRSMKAFCGWLSLLLVSLTPAVGADSPVPSLPDDIPRDAWLSTVLMSGNPAGQQATWSAADGTVHVFFQFNDRGRGPVIRSTYKLGGDGTPDGTTHEGHDYLKAGVNETFLIADGRAEWRSASENGVDEKAAGKFFLSLNGPPEELAMLARGALAHDGRIDLLPAGTARAERLQEMKVAAGDRTETARLIAMTGLDFSPTYLWLDSQDRFFAQGDTWMMVVRQGWEGVVKDLIDAQQKITTRRAADFALKEARRPAGPLVIRHAAVFDPETLKVTPDQTILIEGTRIRSVGNGGKLPPGATVIDAAGMMALPGLWDMHVHLSGNDGLLDIAAGVTTVRDLANDIDDLAARRRRYDSGEEIGPRVIAAGFIDGPGPYQGPSRILAATADEARKYVRMYHDLGYPQIKIYSSLDPQIVPKVYEEAHALGMRVSGHIPAFMTAEQCVRLGQDEIQHMNFIFLNFMPDVGDTRTPARFTEPAARGAGIDVTSAQVQAFLALLHERHTAVDPTLNIFEGMFTDREGQVPERARSIADRLPAQLQRGLKKGGLPVPEGMDARYRASFANMKTMLKAMYDLGITIEAGTDDLAGFALHRELEIYADAGIPAPAVLRLATLGAARVMGRDRDLGRIVPGRLADIILVEGDPTRTLGDIRRVRTVIKDGVIHNPAEIDRFLGIKPN
jgi:imidazolonepropionase-like amidohydrolase